MSECCVEKKKRRKKRDGKDFRNVLKIKLKLSCEIWEIDNMLARKKALNCDRFYQPFLVVVSKVP